MEKTPGIADENKGTHRRYPRSQTFENKSVFIKSTGRPGRQRKKVLSNQNSRIKTTNPVQSAWKRADCTLDSRNLGLS